MFQKSRKFKDWADESQSDPAAVVQRFVQQVGKLSPNLRKASFAYLPEPVESIEQFTRFSSQLIKNALSGIPYIFQDLFDVSDWPTACGAPFKELSMDTAESNCRLYHELEKRGAVCLGKTPPSEFGVDPKGFNPTFEDCPHPSDSRLVLGGGAGASANSVHKGYVPLAFGLDTYGGIRIPAAMQGLFGFRMEPNQLAREGVFPIAPSLESVGFFTNSIGDLGDTIRSLYQINSWGIEETIKGCLVPDISGSVTSEIKAGILKLTRHLNIEEDLSVSTDLAQSFRDAKRTLDVILSRELYSVHRYWIEEYETAYDPHLLQMIENGMDCSPSAAEAASMTQLDIRSKLTEIFQKYDYIVMPISTEANPLLDEWNQELEDEILHLIAPASLAGIPTVILPFSCDEDRYSAAQILINPHKLQLVPALLNLASPYYSDEILELPSPISETDSLSEDIDLIDRGAPPTY